MHGENQRGDAIEEALSGTPRSVILPVFRRFSSRLNLEIAAMLERECTLYANTMHFLRLLLEGIDDAKFAAIPAPGINPPAWILGHLAVAADYVPQLLGEKRACSEQWHKELFGPGTQPTADRARYPSKAELTAAVETAFQRNLGLVRNVSAEKLAAPQPIEYFRPQLPTIGDMLAHLMSTHPAFHLGQLSVWRRLTGLPGVLKFPS